MRPFLASGHSTVFLGRTGENDTSEFPGFALLHAIAGGLMDLLGPMFWAALIVLWLQAETLSVRNIG